MIDGVLLFPLRTIPGDQGMVLHMLRSDAAHFTRFGEAYFSTVNPHAVKAWKRHRRMEQNLAVPVGKVRFVIYDDREGSPTRGTVAAIDIGESRYALLRIPAGLWYGFSGLSVTPALIANCPDLPHDPTEMDRLPADDPSIPYRW